MTRSSRNWSSAAPPATPQAGIASGSASPAHATRGRAYGEPFGRTDRVDNWWAQPLSQAIGLGLLGLYATWAALQGKYYEYGPYLSPFYSPLFKPAWWPISPAFLIVWVPGGFRATCYYYRKAYYRAFFADPAACAVGEPRTGYLGETKFPFILQNAHRYFLYLATLVLIFLWVDVVRSFTFDGRFGIGVGSLVETVTVALLTGYSLSCHSLRHLVGGRIDCFSCAVAGGPQHRTWSAVSRLNEHHMGWAWWSLFFVCFADFYIRMCSMGIFHDLRLL
jgi:hypothetical protein